MVMQSACRKRCRCEEQSDKAGSRYSPVHRCAQSAQGYRMKATRLLHPLKRDSQRHAGSLSRSVRSIAVRRADGQSRRGRESVVRSTDLTQQRSSLTQRRNLSHCLFKRPPKGPSRRRQVGVPVWSWGGDCTIFRKIPRYFVHISNRQRGTVLQQGGCNV